MDELLYQMIFKRKSFHIMKSELVISEDEINDIYKIFDSLKPLHKKIKVKIKIVNREETTCPRGQYCILFYSENKEGYEANIGYIGEQLDLYLASKDIGVCWYGFGKTAIEDKELQFVMMMAIQKQEANEFRKDMFKSKRKSLDEIWLNDNYLEIANIVRFTPSSCNSQPWFIETDNKQLLVYRVKGKRGMMPKDRVVFSNRIDMGIFCLMMELCLKHYQYQYQRHLYDDNEDIDKAKFARYEILN